MKYLAQTSCIPRKDFKALDDFLALRQITLSKRCSYHMAILKRTSMLKSNYPTLAQLFPKHIPLIPLGPVTVQSCDDTLAQRTPSLAPDGECIALLQSH